MTAAQQGHRKAAILPHVQQAMSWHIIRVRHPAELLPHRLRQVTYIIQQGESLICSP